MHARRGPTTPKDKSRELQRKLYLAAKRSRDRRFHALYDRMFRRNMWLKTLKAAGGRLSESRMRENRAPCHALRELPTELVGVQGK